MKVNILLSGLSRKKYQKAGKSSEFKLTRFTVTQYQISLSSWDLRLEIPSYFNPPSDSKSSEHSTHDQHSYSEGASKVEV